MKIVKGDLFTFGGSIGHGVNCRGYMDSGIAVSFKKQFPDMFEEYVDKCNKKLLKPGDVYIYENGGDYIYNLASQDAPGANAKIDYLAVSAKRVLEHASAHGIKTVALPKIGSGVGGLDWKEVEKTLLQVERNQDSYFTIYEL